MPYIGFDEAFGQRFFFSLLVAMAILIFIEVW